MRDRRNSDRTRILRVIARLNVGGPAIQAITLTRLLDERGYETRLVRGREGPREGSMDGLAAELGVQPIDLPTLRRRIGLGDVASLVFLVREIRRFRPDILHTHTAKAGALGRTAAILAAGARPPVIVHTFHGHVLTGYFPRPIAAAFTLVERTLAKFTTCVVAVSEEVRDDLVRLRVAPPEKIVVLPLGFDFSRFDVPEDERRRRRERFRRGLGIPPHARVVTLVGRLEPIKRVDRFLRVANLIDAAWDARFLVVGDGSLREELQQSGDALKLRERLVWAGLRDDMPDVYFASDVVAVTSDNEGTNVSAIEAQAAGVPVVTADVGGMVTVVAHAETGYVAALGQEQEFAHAIGKLLDHADDRSRMGAAGRARVLSAFAIERLVQDAAIMYEQLLGRSADCETTRR